jgi:ribonuclease I
MTAGNREGEIFMPLGQEFGAREEDHIAVSAQGDLAIVKGLSLGVAKEARFDPEQAPRGQQNPSPARSTLGALPARQGSE